MKKVLHIVNGEFYAGAERVQDLLAARLPDYGYAVGFACLKDGAFATMRSTRSASLVHMPMQSRFDLGIGNRLAEFMRAENFAAIHTHTPRSALAGYLATRETGLPLIHHVHSPAARDTTDRLRNFINAHVEKFCSQRAGKLIAVSTSLGAHLRDNGFPDAQITLVPNGVPVSEAPRLWQPPQEIWTLGFAALIRPRKGIEILLQSLAALRDRGHPARLRIVGAFESLDYEKTIKNLAEQLGLSSAIDWIGFTKDISAEFTQIDILVVPSLFGEGLPMVIIEAMAAGLPILATKVEGIPEVLESIDQNCVVPPHDAGALTDRLEAIMKGKIDARLWSERGLQRQRDYYSDHSMAKGVAAVYRSLDI